MSLTTVNQGGEVSRIRLSRIPVLETPQDLTENALHALQCWQARPGEIFTVSDPAGHCYRGRLTRLNAASGTIIPFYAFTGAVESATDLHVYQALPDKERFELILQKLTELGVKRIVPFVSQRSLTLKERDRGQKKSHRWPHILIRAARQCRREVIPELTTVVSWHDVIAQLRFSNLTLLLNERETANTLREVLQNAGSGPVSLIVGPEGGLTDREIDTICSIGGHSITLGRRILRTETASIVAAALIQHETGGL